MKEKTMMARLVETFVLNTMSSEATIKVGNECDVKWGHGQSYRCNRISLKLHINVNR